MGSKKKRKKEEERNEYNKNSKEILIGRGMRYVQSACVCACVWSGHDPTNLATLRYYMYKHAYMGMVLNTLFPLREVLRQNSIAHKTMSTQTVTFYGCMDFFHTCLGFF